MKKLLGKTLLYLSILLLIPYSYLVWQAKQGVDAFLLSHDFGAEINYEWLLLDHTGNIVLLEVVMGEHRQEPILTADRVNIIPPSVFDLLGAKDAVIHNEYPAYISVEVLEGNTNVTEKLAGVLGLSYQPEYLDYFYPKQCLTVIQKEIKPLRFSGAANFTVQRTADVSEVKFKVKSLDLANISGSLKINNFSEGITGGSFVSDFAVTLSDISLLQQNTQKCLAKLDMDKQLFIESSISQQIEKASEHLLALEENAPNAVAQFLFVPQKIDIAFDIEEGKKFSQIPMDPIYQVPEKLGLGLILNSQPLNVIFDQVQSETLVSEKIENTEPVDGIDENTAIAAKPIENKVLQKYQLKQHIGAKISLELRNGKVVEGYIQSVNSRSLILLQRKFKGKTVAPFAFNDIRKITLVNPEK